MNIITIGWWTLVNIITIDILARLLQRHTRETPKFRAAGLLAMLILALQGHQTQVPASEASIKRFFLATIMVIMLMIASFGLLRDGLPLEQGLGPSSLALMPLIAMPFYHLLFALVGNNPIALSASIRNFRMRAMLGLVIGANIIMVGLALEPSLVIQSIHFCLALIALAHVLYLCSRPCAKLSFYNLRQEDFDRGPSAFMNYLASLLEFFFYILLVYFAFGPTIIVALALGQPPYLVVPIFIGALYIVALILAKLLLISRALLKSDFYEDRILPLTFLLFGITYVYQLNF